ncbi:MAG: efflux RND transporter periplasmic adaptor subunit [Azonexus sp.]|nr:efflux RND transporter periplasmic adaptor subunit [Azonexus sp.]
MTSTPARWALALVMSAALMACSEKPLPTKASETKTPGLSLAEGAMKFLEVEAAGTRRGALSGLIPGRVEFRPQAYAAIGAPVSARVLSIEVRPGDVVRKGASLMVLQGGEVAGLRSSLTQAEAKAAAAEDLLKRQNEMLKKGVGLEVERFEAETRAREARAELEHARSAVAMIGGGSGDRFSLSAPSAGVVIAVKASVGAVVASGGEALIEIGDPSKLWVVAELPESEVAGLAVGRQGEIRVPGVDARFEAVVEGVGKVVDGERRRLPIYLTLKGASPKLTPGMLAEIRLTDATEAALSLPITAVLIKDGSRRIVYIQNAEGKFEARTVRTGLSREGRVSILEGLTAGEKVVVRGALLLDAEAEQLL